MKLKSTAEAHWKIQKYAETNALSKSQRVREESHKRNFINYFETNKDNTSKIMGCCESSAEKEFYSYKCFFKKKKKTSTSLNSHFIEPQKEQTKPKANKGRKE